MMNATEIISSIEEMTKRIETLEKENENLRIEIWNKNKEISLLKGEIEKWKNIVMTSAKQKKDL